MADFCKQCHDKLFKPLEDSTKYDFYGLSTPEDDKNELYPVVLCEGCKIQGGYIQVNSKGECISPDCGSHGGKIYPIT
ncbi:MAG TPA: hypothetical protein VI815_02740 [Candidatus Nanoarchaeia archaeon]|nr:hypothetical protein [Candidatus Nanoarchaeia archaeon]